METEDHGECKNNVTETGINHGHRSSRIDVPITATFSLGVILFHYFRSCLTQNSFQIGALFKVFFICEYFVYDESITN